MQSAAAVVLMLLSIFAAYTAAVTHDAFQWAGQKMPLSLVESGPHLTPVCFLVLGFTRVTYSNGI